MTRSHNSLKNFVNFVLFLNLENSHFAAAARRLDGDDVDIDVSDVEVTHRCCHKFIPRHAGELFIEIGDPLYVDAEEDDLWCRGTMTFDVKVKLRVDLK